MNNEQLRINLMVDYVDWVDRDYADISQSNWRGVLSNDQINSWHNTMVLCQLLIWSLLKTPLQLLWLISA
jgi:hypothetical protein